MGSIGIDILINALLPISPSGIIKPAKKLLNLVKFKAHTSILLCIGFRRHFLRDRELTRRCCTLGVWGLGCWIRLVTSCHTRRMNINEVPCIPMYH